MFKTVSFAEVFGMEKDDGYPINGIRIPRIQRDYAQGRDSVAVGKIRYRFLRNIHEALVSGKELVLDFVYGDVDDNGIFMPFDGQQRLTTLFLLHWYALQRKADRNTDRTTKNGTFLWDFTYETRPSSRQFCQRLAVGKEYPVDVTKGSISAQIRNCAGYSFSWDHDPTIDGMLRMLDAIGEVFYDVDDLWDKLVVRRLVKFHLLLMKDMGLTDSLYIRMNSRGKPLTQFEHFKAEFERIVGGVSLDERSQISRRLDVEWADLLLPYRNGKNVLDDAFLGYFRFVNHLICYRDGISIVGDEFAIAERLYAGNLDRIRFLKRAFDCWQGVDVSQLFNSFFVQEGHVAGRISLFGTPPNLFKLCVKDRVSQGLTAGQELLLFALVLYLQNRDEIGEEQMRSRLRILRNLIANSPDAIRPGNMTQLFEETHELVLNGTLPNGASGFSSSQKQDEIRKQSYLTAQPDQRENIEMLEDLDVFGGCLSAIDDSNIINSAKVKGVVEYNDWRLVQKALLTCGDYSQTFRRNHDFGAAGHIKELFHPSNVRGNFKETKRVFNELVAKVDENNIGKSLKDAVKAYLQTCQDCKSLDWRYYFVKYNNASGGSYGRYLWWHKHRGYNFLPDYFRQTPYEIVLLNKDRLMGKGWNIFLRILATDSRLRGYVRLGDYANSDDNKLIVNTTGTSIDCRNDHYEITFADGAKKLIGIPQVNGIDSEDRIEIGCRLVLELARR